MSETLPLSNTPAGFTKQGVVEWVSTKLGDLVWRLEGFDCTRAASQAVEDSLMVFSEKYPLIGYDQLPTGAREWHFPDDAMGVMHVFFTDGTKFFTQTAYDMNKSLTGVSSIQMAGGKVGEYADFLMWRKTFQRILGVRATWLADEGGRRILITNATGYKPCIMYTALRPFDKVPYQHRTLVRDLAYAEAMERLGNNRNKYGGQLQGPGGTTLTLNGKELLDKAATDKEKLLTKLEGIKLRFPIMFD